MNPTDIVDLKRLYIGTLGTIIGQITKWSSDDLIKLLGGGVSFITILYLTACLIQKVQQIIKESRSKIEQDKGE